MRDFLTIYERYCQPDINIREIKHTQLVHLIHRLPSLFTVTPVGKSVEKRTVYGIRTGNGSLRVLLWSQMHGDESTATRALFDVFRFLNADDEYNEQRKQIMEKLDLLFIPMLNPDGAERFQRENTWGIDINRDARKGTTPEARILQEQTIAFQPYFSFNLHDQESYYSAGVTRIPATIAFLAPPPDAEESITDNRRRAMQLIVRLNKKLQPVIPGGVAKWSDTYEPRAFGEWSQAQNSATILVESGGYYNDPERNYVRKLNFAILLESLLSIASETYITESIDPYFTIPYNREKGIFDHIDREKLFSSGESSFVTDRGIRGAETVLGDLATYGSLDDPE